jgi:cytochrome c biogenesis protein CcmG, thiol:disulfide interchange protein DsbE
MRFIPIFLFLIVAVLMATATHLEDNPKFMPNMIGKKITVLNDELTKEVSVLNIWASWCIACQAEHEVLLNMQKEGLPIYGLNSGDKPDLAQNYLNKMGNPFKKVIEDPRREYAIALGSTGMPETYVIGKDGIIYYHYRGNLTEEVVKTKLRPIYDALVKK